MARHGRQGPRELRRWTGENNHQPFWSEQCDLRRRPGPGRVKFPRGSDVTKILLLVKVRRRSLSLDRHRGIQEDSGRSMHMYPTFFL